ncbi:glycosyltransferase, partial [Vibrio vulnificus]|nr:glycosyltransferase [Vibrio vulnificus]
PGSTDGSRELIESYGDKIKRVFMPDKGPADGLNNGFKVASGQYFYFINSDDMLLPNAISEMKSAIQNSVEKYDVYCFGGYMIDAKSRNLRPMRTFNYSSSNFCRGGTSIFQQGLLFSSIKYIEAGGFDINNRTCWDARLMFDLAMNGASFCDVNKKIACFRIHDESITGSANNL